MENGFEVIMFAGPWEMTENILSVIIVTVFMIFISFFIWRKIHKADSSKPPTYFQALTENAVGGFENYMTGITGGKLKKFYPYFFTLFFFIFFASITDLIGIIPGAASMGFTLTLGFITFIGIYFFGIIGMGFIGFIKKKYRNPLEILTQFSPFISISLRLFGSTFAIVILAAVIPEIFAPFISQDALNYIFPWFTIIYMWAISGFAAAMAAIQALVFITLTAVYWTQNLKDEDIIKIKKAEKKKAKVEYKEKKLKNKGNLEKAKFSRKGE